MPDRQLSVKRTWLGALVSGRMRAEHGRLVIVLGALSAFGPISMDTAGAVACLVGLTARRRGRMHA